MIISPESKIPIKVVVLFLILFSWLISISSRAEAGRESSQVTSQAFVTYQYIDPVTGMETFNVLVPRDWKVEGGVTWSADPALPARSSFRFYNPNGPEELNFFPTRAFFWTDNSLFLTTNPPGSLRFGTLVRSPVGLHDAFSRTIIPGANRNMRGAAIVEEGQVPELAELAKGIPTRGINAFAEAGKMRIEYNEGGRRLEEEFYAAVSQFVIQTPASMTSVGYYINYWYMDYVFSFRGEKEKLNSHSKIFQTMIYSVKLNQDWAAKVMNVKEALAQQYIQGIKAIGRMGETIAKAGSRMREDQQRSWEQRQQVNDRIAQNFSDYIRGVDRYYDSRAGKEVELPSGYGNAWANDLGEYIVTESPSYNPNLESNQHWEQLESVR